MLILVTGATGKVGRTLIARLLEDRYPEQVVSEMKKALREKRAGQH